MMSSIKKSLKSFADNGLNLIVLSILTGVTAGVVITFYNIFIHEGEHYSVLLYSACLNNPVFIPLLFILLFCGALLVGTLVKFVPMIRGSGIPQIEGAARGTVAFKWYVTLCSMFAASLACVFLGLSAGGEGPSLEMGGCCGQAVGVTLKRNYMARRLQVASGASAGLAVAFNAPITGMIFALEEAFRSFSAQVFICSAISVGCSLVIRNCLRTALGLSVGFAFDGFVFNSFAFSDYGYVLIATLICAVCGALTYYLVMLFRQIFKKITFFKKVGKYVIPFTLAGVFGLISFYAMGGGSTFINALSTNGTGIYSLESVFGADITVTIAVIVVMKLIATLVNMGCGVPCGAFIPMLAVGAGIGGALSNIFVAFGMQPELCDYLVVLCMATYFTCVVKAPITGIVMCFELTGQFANSLPVLIGVTVGYLISELFRTQPIYEKLLEQFLDDEGYTANMKKERVRAVIMPNSIVDGNRVRKVIWPVNGLVVEITQADGKVLVPDGETIMHTGEQILFECETSDVNRLIEYISDLTGDKDIRLDK